MLCVCFCMLFYLFAGGKTQGGDQTWTLERLQAYISHAKSFQPEITAEAEQVLARYYQLHRSADNRQSARTTIRLLESMVRLAQAHARFLCRNEVLLQDAIVAITIMETTMQVCSPPPREWNHWCRLRWRSAHPPSFQGAALLGSCSPLHSAFPVDPEAEVSQPIPDPFAPESIIRCRAVLGAPRSSSVDVVAVAPSLSFPGNKKWCFASYNSSIWQQTLQTKVAVGAQAKGTREKSIYLLKASIDIKAPALNLQPRDRPRSASAVCTRRQEHKRSRHASSYRGMQPCGRRQKPCERFRLRAHPPGSGRQV